MITINEFKKKLLQEELYYKNADNYAKQTNEKVSVIIWGTGYGGQLVYKFLEEHGALRNVEYFADNNKNKWGDRQNGLLILSPEDVLKAFRDNTNIKIIVGSQYLSEIKEQLLSLGITESAIDIRGFGLAWDYYTFKSKTPYQIINSYMKEYETVYSYLSDERSKDVFLGVLNSKISLDNKYLENLHSPSVDQYFEKEIIKLSDKEVFCDCGSFNGDTLENFFTLTGGNFKKYIAIEANKEIYNELNTKVKVNDYKNVETFNLACWNEKAVLKFKQGQTDGHITEHGDVSVQADCLDNIVQDKVTILKMDIEGAEEKALRGGSGLIKEYKPVLAICLYHSLEDYFRLPLLMKELNPEYDLFIRLYTNMVAVETVCYAVPKERLI